MMSRGREYAYEEIARRCESSRAQATKELARDVLPCGGGFACYSGKGGFANRAAGIGLAPTTTEAEIDALLRFYEERDEEAVVELSPYVDPTLIKLLGERGFVLKHTVNVLMLTLSEWQPPPPPPPPRVPEDFEIAQLTDKSNTSLLREIVEANERGFEIKDARLAPEMTIMLALKALSSETTDGFYARSKSGTREIVAVGLTGTREKLATLFGATTLKECRGHGLQRALMVKRIELAKERGCDHAVVLTSPGKTTEHNATALGFKMAYTHLALRKPRPNPAI
jgi:GNAT superfamily N-acetyltransferase